MGFKNWLAPPDRLVALTCLRCGLLKDGSKFGVANGKIRSACKQCMNATARSALTEAQRQRANDLRREKQAHTATHASSSQRRWTVEDVEILTRGDLSELEKADILGRSYASLQVARRHLNAGTLAGFEVTHGDTGYRYHGCRCEECKAAHRVRSKRLGERFRAEQQAATLETASRWGQPWTGVEMELLATRVGQDMTLREAAVMLGRTYAACRMRRTLALTDPKWMKLAGVEDA